MNYLCFDKETAIQWPSETIWCWFLTRLDILPILLVFATLTHFICNKVGREGVAIERYPSLRIYGQILLKVNPRQLKTEQPLVCTPGIEY